MRNNVFDNVPHKCYYQAKQWSGKMDNKFISTREIAEKWGISDRRVRVLCRENKIPGAVKDGKSYEIPMNATKPIDGRLSSSAENLRYLKWDDEIIGIIQPTNTVKFIKPNYNETAKIYTRGEKLWAGEQFIEFLSERTVSRERRDIEKILFRCGLSHFDVLRITEVTRAVHPKDLLWIANNKNEKISDIVTDVFTSVFRRKLDMTGDSIDTPEGYNIKRYGVYKGRYGIYKQRINPLTTDVESEVAVYLLAKKMNVPCCPAYRTDENTVFSTFLYDFSSEYVVHFRRFFESLRSDNEYQNLISVRPQFKDDIIRMIILDFVTRQDDRHLSNIALKIHGQNETFYPLYDNGRSLFYEDTQEIVTKAVSDSALNATGFGFSGTYWDYLQEIVQENKNIKELINLDVSEKDIIEVLKSARFKGYRFEGALEWIIKTLDMVRNLV